MATAVMAAANATKRISRRLLRLIKYAKGPSAFIHNKSDPNRTLEALERWSGRATLIILGGILVEIGYLWLVPHDFRERLWGTVANGLIGIGLVVEYVIIGRIIITSGEADRQSKERISAAESRAAEAHERAAEAQLETERLRAANLAVQKLLTPRRITLMPKDEHEAPLRHALLVAMESSPGLKRCCNGFRI